MRVTSVSPSDRKIDDGESVTLAGTGFGSSAGTVSIGGVEQTITDWSDTSITFTTARGSQSMGACRVDVVAGAGTAAFFTDTFSTGDLSHTEGGASWDLSNAGAGDSVAVVSGTGNTGNGLVFTFGGGASGDDAWAEQNFDLGALYSELTIDFDLYIPDGTEAWGGAAYAHRNDSPSNNKFIRLWGADYSDDEKVGASLFYDAAGSNINIEWSEAQGGIGVNEQASASFIRAADLGEWMSVRVYAKAPTASTDGVLRIWKNGSLVIERTAMGNYTVGEPHAYRYGYLLGYANSGFASTTKIVIDNVRVYEGAV